MTLAPLVHPSVRGVKGKPVELHPRCAAPNCLSLAQQRHHCWPKSFLRGQPYEWVTVLDHTVPNSYGLCLRHHDWVTGDKAKIVWDENLCLLAWYERLDGDEWDYVGFVRGQPSLDSEPEAAKVRHAEGLCPTCGRLKPREKIPRGPKRKAKTWGILVPDDSEQGSDVLDTYIEDLAVLMGLDPQSPRLLRYHVLVPVMEWVHQHRTAFLNDWEEAAT